jgi:hypothetical protein
MCCYLSQRLQLNWRCSGNLIRYHAVFLGNKSSRVKICDDGELRCQWHIQKMIMSASHQANCVRGRCGRETINQ